MGLKVTDDHLPTATLVSPGRSIRVRFTTTELQECKIIKHNKKIRDMELYQINHITWFKHGIAVQPTTTIESTS